MDLDFSRRDILFAATGSAVGIALSPLPWKLLGDSAIWTQRSRFAPELLRGDVTTRLSACTLCPAGCALRARCVGGRPVSMAPVPGHPVSRGALCATGFALHHLPAHPLRLKGPAQIAPKSGGVEASASQKNAAVVFPFSLSSFATTTRKNENHHSSREIRACVCVRSRVFNYTGGFGGKTLMIDDEREGKRIRCCFCFFL